MIEEALDRAVLQGGSESESESPVSQKVYHTTLPSQILRGATPKTRHGGFCHTQVLDLEEAIADLMGKVDEQQAEIQRRDKHILDLEGTLDEQT